MPIRKARSSVSETARNRNRDGPAPSLTEMNHEDAARAPEDRGNTRNRRDAGKTFNIVNDFTPEEEAQVREENKWCEEA